MYCDIAHGERSNGRSLVSRSLHLHLPDVIRLKKLILYSNYDFSYSYFSHFFNIQNTKDNTDAYTYSVLMSFVRCYGNLNSDDQLSDNHPHYFPSKHYSWLTMEITHSGSSLMRTSLSDNPYEISCFSVRIVR